MARNCERVIAAYDPANLESGEAILRRSHLEHGCVLQAYLTKTGQKLMPRAHEMVEGIEQCMLAGLDWDKCLRLLDAPCKCTDSLGDKVKR